MRKTGNVVERRMLFPKYQIDLLRLRVGYRDALGTPLQPFQEHRVVPLALLYGVERNQKVVSRW